MKAALHQVMPLLKQRKSSYASRLPRRFAWTYPLVFNSNALASGFFLGGPIRAAEPSTSNQVTHIFLNRTLFIDTVIHQTHYEITPPNGLDIVPWKPTVAQVALQVYANCMDLQAAHNDQSNSQPSNEEHQVGPGPASQLSQTSSEAQAPCSRKTQKKQAIRIPTVLSKENQATPIKESNVRCSPRINKENQATPLRGSSPMQRR